MKGVLNEDEILSNWFSNRCKKSEPPEKLVAYFQALYYESKLRSQEKGKIIDKMNACYEQKLNHLKQMDHIIKKLSYELNLFKHLNEIKNERHKGGQKLMVHNDDNFDEAESEIYDWIVDIDLITNVFKEGWSVNFSKQFLENSTLNIQRHVIGERASGSNTKDPKAPSHNEGKKFPNSSTKGHDQHSSGRNKLLGGLEPECSTINWEGAIVAVVGNFFCFKPNPGLYDKGKTFV